MAFKVVMRGELAVRKEEALRDACYRIKTSATYFLRAQPARKL
jgi:hypothetical protein